MMLNRFVKKLFTFLYINIILFILPSPTLAIDQGFYSTISLSIRSIGKQGVTYNPSQIVGDYTYDVVRQKSMDFLTNDEYRARIYNHYQYVALPPYSEIDIGYYWLNNTPNSVDIETVRIPMSRQLLDRGDVTNILYDIGFGQGVTCTDTHCKGGKYLDVEGVGLISSDIAQNAKKGIVLETLTVKLPVEITKYEVEYLSQYDSRVMIHVRNITNQYLSNVWINYKGDVSQIIDLEAYQEKVLETYKQCDLIDNQLHCGTVRIIDNNMKTECFMYGSSWDNYNEPDSISVFNKINGSWVAGAQVRPTLESFCVQRIPYTYTTEEIVIEVEPEEPVMTKEEYWEDLLGISILPITSYETNKLERYLTLLKPLRIDNLNIL